MQDATIHNSLPLRELERMDLHNVFCEELAIATVGMMFRFPDVHAHRIHMDSSTAQTFDGYAERYSLSRTETMRRAAAALLREEAAQIGNVGAL